MKNYGKFIFSAEMFKSYQLICDFEELNRQYQHGGTDSLWAKNHDDAVYRLLHHAKNLLPQDEYCDFYFEIHPFLSYNLLIETRKR
jgi:hypothetical protein